MSKKTSMKGPSAPLLQRALDVFEQLPPEDREALIEEMRRRIADQRRTDAAAALAETRAAYRSSGGQRGASADMLGARGDVAMQLVIEYPKLLPDALQQTRAAFEQEARMAMAVKLFEMKRLPSGIAAGLAGVDRVTFLLSLHRYGVDMIDLDEDELLSDLENA